MVNFNAQQGIKLTPLATEPSPVSKGVMYFDNASSSLKISNDGTTFTSLANSPSILKDIALGHIRTLLDRSIPYDITDVFGEAYITASGRNSTANPSTIASGMYATFNTNKYRIPPVTETVTWVTNGNSTTSARLGIAIIPFTKITGLVCTKHSSTNGTNAYLYEYTNPTQITSVAFVGHVATFTGLNLIPGRYYTVVTDSTTIYSDNTGNAKYGETFVVIDGAVREDFIATAYNFISIQATIDLTQEQTILHTFPTGRFSSAIDGAHMVPLFTEYETGASAQFKLRRTYNDGSNHVETPTWTAGAAVAGKTLFEGMTFINNQTSPIYLISVTKHANCTATTCNVYIPSKTNPGAGSPQVISNGTAFVGNVATFATPLKIEEGVIYVGPPPGPSYSSVPSTSVTLPQVLTNLTMTAGVISISGGQLSTTTVYNITAVTTQNQGVETTSWLDSNIDNSFTAFTGQVNEMLIKLNPKPTSPTVNYPSIAGLWIKEL